MSGGWTFTTESSREVELYFNYHGNIAGPCPVTFDGEGFWPIGNNADGEEGPGWVQIVPHLLRRGGSNSVEDEDDDETHVQNSAVKELVGRACECYVDDDLGNGSGFKLSQMGGE